MSAHARILKGCDNNRSCKGGKAKQQGLNTPAHAKKARGMVCAESYYSKPSLFSLPRVRDSKKV